MTAKEKLVAIEKELERRSVIYKEKAVYNELLEFIHNLGKKK